MNSDTVHEIVCRRIDDAEEEGKRVSQRCSDAGLGRRTGREWVPRGVSHWGGRMGERVRMGCNEDGRLRAWKWQERTGEGNLICE